MDTFRGLSLFQQYTKDVQQNYDNKLEDVLKSKYYPYFDAVINNPHFRISLSAGSRLYRARNNHGKPLSKTTDFGPNRKCPDNNRASPKGLSYMYLADKPLTVAKEIRPSNGDIITIAEFKVKKPLNLLLLGQISNWSNFDCFNLDEKTVMQFALMISNSFTKDVDVEKTDYIPSQIFARYCNRKGISGIKYISNAAGSICINRPDNSNIVLFGDADPDNIGNNKECPQGSLLGKTLDEQLECITAKEYVWYEDNLEFRKVIHLKYE